MKQGNATITILGAGYVGLSTAALLSNCGYTVYVVEPNAERLRTIKTGKSFFFEAGIDPLLAAAVTSGTLIPTDSYEQSAPNSSIVFSCVGTPDNPDGSLNLAYVHSAAKQAAILMKPGSIFVQKSTVPVGTGAVIQELFSTTNTNIAYVSNPEFLRESTAIGDTLWPDRVVAGSDNRAALETILDVYKSIANNQAKLANIANITAPSKTPETEYISTSIPSAELIKVTANAFLALKISFANSIAMLADVVNADVAEVMNAVGADNRIGRQFLQAGRGYGGGCFPKDVDGLIQSGLANGVDLNIMKAAQEINHAMPSYVVTKITNTIGNLSNKKIAVLGLAFKAGTSDVRKSPGIAIANILAKNNAIVTAYDPEANHEAKPELHSSITLAESLQDALLDAEAIVIATNWADFSLEELASKNTPSTVLVDAVNMHTRQAAESHGFTYIGIGR